MANRLSQTQDQIHILVEQSLLGVQTKERLEHRLPNVSAAPIVTLVDRMIQMAVESRASDIHIEPTGEQIRLRFRVDGFLTELLPSLPLALKNVLVARIKVMAQIDTTIHNLPLDGRMTYMYDGRPIDIRVSTLPVMDGEKIVLRLLSGAHRVWRLDELDFSPPNMALFQQWCHLPQGLILNVGPVNSGKTTTLYAALQALNVPEKNIVTIEDPVEYYLPGVNQVQVNTKAVLSFAAGLRALLRQDPDICMVGEIRDEETAEIAVRAALTGRLLFTTLHTGSAVGAVFRLLDMGIKPYFLFASLAGIVAQRLVRRLCPLCREAYEVAEGSWEAAFLGGEYRPGLTLFRAVGCGKCRGSGYQGRLAIHELLAFSPAIQEALAAGEPPDMIGRVAIQQGMIPLQRDGVVKAMAGQTTLAEIRRILYGSI